MKQPVSIMLVILLISLAAANAGFAQTTAFIANSGDDEVLRVIADSEAVTTTPVTGTPYGVAVTLDGQRVLVTQNENDALVFIDTADFSGSPFTLPVGEAPRGVAIDTIGRYAYVANFEADTVSQVNLSGRNVVDTIPVGDGPWGVVAHYHERDDATIAYVANHLEDTVTRIDEENRTTEIPVGDGPIGVAISPDGSWVYVANTNDDTVSIIDTRSETVVGTVSVGTAPWGIAVGADGDYVYVSNSEADTVTVIRAADLSVIRTFAVGDTPRGIAAPRNGQIAYVVNQIDGSISKIDMEADEVSEIAASMLVEAFSLGAFFGGRKPLPPSGLEAVTRDETGIDLSWIDESSDELGFKIERSQDDEENFVPIATVPDNTTSFEDGGLSNDTVYYYRIRAFNEAADSSYSATATATTDRYTGSIWCFIGSLNR